MFRQHHRLIEIIRPFALGNPTARIVVVGCLISADNISRRRMKARAAEGFQGNSLGAFLRLFLGRAKNRQKETNNKIR